MELNNDGAQALANAIIKQACIDYVDAKMGKVIDQKSPEYIIRKCEKFFNSPEYGSYTTVSGTWLMKMALVQHYEKIIEIYKSYLSITGESTITIRHKENKEPLQSYRVEPTLVGMFDEVIEKQIEILKKKVDDLKNGIREEL